jgi:transposase
MIHHNHIGCDIGKQAIDIYDPLTCRWQRIDNTAPALTTFAATLEPGSSFVVMEATGGHDRLLRHCLSAFGIAHARINPVMVRRFAQARGQLAKTDRLDARILSQFGSLFKPDADQPPSMAHDELVSLARRRDQLVEFRAAELRHLGEAVSKIAVDDIKAGIADLDLRVTAIERAIQKLVAADAALSATAKRLQSAPGVGPVTAIALMAHMPELGHLTPKTAASLAGLAPINKDSGKRSGHRSIRGGRPRLRRALYMAALAATHSKSRFRDFYTTIAARSGSKKIAIIAVARKLLTVLNAMQRDKTCFQ